MLQTEALDILKLGHNIYLTGAAGSGKTYVLNEFIKHLRDNEIAVGVTASTGIAATHMNGMTIHSWAGIGIMDELSDADIEEISQKTALRKRIRNTKVLIIDEVSMLHGKRLDMVERVTRAIKDETKPFGGLQVVLCGDLFQLPPVNRERKEADFVFQSKAWKNMRLQVCYLSEQYRQEDQRLLNVLSAIRASEVDEDHFEILKDRFKEPDVEIYTQLYTHNSAVDDINQSELDNLDEEERTFLMNLEGNKKVRQVLAQNCLAPEVLHLKKGAEVMFVANDPMKGFVNGTLGQIIDFDETGYPVVAFGSREVVAEPHSWKTQDGNKVVAEVTQIPLRLAWAITVHKSQGMSLDAVELDLSKSFEPGMGYVALSRVRSLEGLFIKGINNTALMVHAGITELDRDLRSKSDEARIGLSRIKKKQLEDFHKRVRAALQSDEAKLLDSYDQELFKKLKAWRTKEAKKQSVPAYLILGDNTLKFIAAIKPKTRKDLSNIKGIGAQKLKEYEKPLLKITSAKK